MSSPRLHSFYFGTEINTIDKILPTVSDNTELPNFERTHIQTITKHMFHTVQTKRKLLSLRMQ